MISAISSSTQRADLPPVIQPEALDAVKARLQAVNADVQVEQEEYDEIVAIKALFLNHDYQ